MDRGLAIVIGMTIAYAASLLGMFVARRSYLRNQAEKESGTAPQSEN